MMRFPIQRSLHRTYRPCLLSNTYRSFRSSLKVLAGGQDQEEQNHPISTFGSHCFSREMMREYFDKSTFNQFVNAIDNKQQLPKELIEKFASGVTRWAVDHDCTHMTHVFQPLSGGFGEKHDIMFSTGDLDLVPSLTASKLLHGEPDASSFPNNGTRPTHAARGNSIWDPSSNITLTKVGESTTLRIPSVFCGWNNVSLDFKTPLLRSEEALGKSTLKVLHALGHKNHTRFHCYSGLEQEFFLVDEEFYSARPDLVIAGRTLVGRMPPRDQGHSDQYFGWQSSRAQTCIYEIEQELWKLGIPNCTRHREVAPSQYEMATTYQTANQANDNNLLMMKIMSEIAARHSLVCLFHEKPFANVNGSGKHNNWSFGTNIQDNFFSPKSEFFMLAVAAFTRAVHLHSDLIRASVATSGNDHRLGGHEAPPGIISIFLGDTVSNMVQCAMEGKPFEKPPSEPLQLGVSYLPEFIRQPSDRNRTSPIAFCDNRFEFRAVGSSVNTAWSTTVLNTITAESMDYLAGEIENAKQSGVADPMQKVISETLQKHKAVLFDGDNYSEEWAAEAASRGLPNIPNTAAALKTLSLSKVEKLFTSTNVLSAMELQARAGVFSENFCLDVITELRCLTDMVNQLILPAACRQVHQLCESKVLEQKQEKLRKMIDNLYSAVDNCTILEEKLSKEGDIQRKVDLLQNEVRPAMENIRFIADNLEGQVDQKFWPLPSYNQLLNYSAK